MKRSFAVLLFVALSCADCYAGGGWFSWFCGPSVDDRGGCGCCCGEVNDPYATGGCCPYGGCAQGCGQCGGGAAGECGLCRGASNCGLFNRYCGPQNTVGCGPCGPYDYNACGRMPGCCGFGGGCGNGCGNGYGAGFGHRMDCGCDCCSPPPAGGCCRPCGASGDHIYNFNPGPPTAQTAYPYYTTRGPRDFLMGNPPPIGPY